MGFAFPLAAAFLLAAAVHAHAGPAENRLGRQVRQAVLRGDVPTMTALRGTNVNIEARPLQIWRSTKRYNDVRVELTLEGQTFEALVRIPAGLAAAAQKAFRASGTLGDFEPFARDGRIAWQPVIYATTLRPAR